MSETNLQINAVYQRFCKAYAHLDAEGIASTYAEQGIEVYLIADRPPAIVYGRDAIQAGIQQFFDYVREHAHRLTVIFRIVQRQMENQQIFDTGFYQVSILQGDEVLRKQFGKVAIILQRNSDDGWEYLYDANGSATQEEFEKANPILNGEIS